MFGGRRSGTGRRRIRASHARRMPTIRRSPASEPRERLPRAAWDREAPPKACGGFQSSRASTQARPGPDPGDFAAAEGTTRSTCAHAARAWNRRPFGPGRDAEATGTALRRARCTMAGQSGAWPEHRSLFQDRRRRLALNSWGRARLSAKPRGEDPPHLQALYLVLGAQNMVANVVALRHWRHAQRRERDGSGLLWTHTGLVFTDRGTSGSAATPRGSASSTCRTRPVCRPSGSTAFGTAPRASRRPRART